MKNFKILQVQIHGQCNVCQSIYTAILNVTHESGEIGMKFKCNNWDCGEKMETMVRFSDKGKLELVDEEAGDDEKGA